MKKLILIGSVACGKTTLCQRLNGLTLSYKKTQALEVVQQTIDTPGEYLEHRSFLQALLVTAVEADLALFVQEAGQERYMFSPGLASAFSIPVAGVVSKIDQASPAQVEQAAQLLKLAGADPIFPVSALTGAGMDPLLDYLRD